MAGETLRVVFVGIELAILDALRGCSVDLLGAYVQSLPRMGPRRWPIELRARRKARRRLAHNDAFAARLVERKVKALSAPHVNHADFVDLVRALRPDLGVMANFGEILREPILSIPRLGFINWHPSLLPRFRGPQPLDRILLSGEKTSGVTWHEAVREVDAGDILAQASFAVEADATVRDLAIKSAALGAALLPPLIQAFERGDAVGRPQEHTRASYFPKLTRRQKRALRRAEKSEHVRDEA